jgi:hypothetical protein
VPVRWREAGQAHGSGGAGPSATDDAAGSGAARKVPPPPLVLSGHVASLTPY